MTLPAQRVFLVCPWYGPQTAGGAETNARGLAEALHAAGVAVEVLTTTGRDVFSPGEEPYPAGMQEHAGIPVRRFSLRRDDGAAWQAAHAHLLPGDAGFSAEEQHLTRRLFAQDALFSYIADHRHEGVFLFTPYIWGTTFWGALLAGENAVLLPCLHDEPYASYRTYQYLFRRVRGALMLSLPEQALARQLYDLPLERLPLVGAGVDTSAAGDAARFRERFGLADPFLFYAGRRDRGKQIPTLVEYFAAYQERHPGPLKLVLAGKNPVLVPAPYAGAVVDLGYVAEQDVHDACAAAALVCQPSRYESFSLLLMEAWLHGTPVLVNAACAVTAHHCRESNGGLYFQGYAEFEACLEALLEQPALRQRLGQQGRRYVLANYAWPAVARRVVEALEALGVAVPARPMLR